MYRIVLRLHGYGIAWCPWKHWGQHECLIALSRENGFLCEYPLKRECKRLLRCWLNLPTMWSEIPQGAYASSCKRRPRVCTCGDPDAGLRVCLWIADGPKLFKVVQLSANLGQRASRLCQFARLEILTLTKKALVR